MSSLNRFTFTGALERHKPSLGADYRCLRSEQPERSLIFFSFQQKGKFAQNNINTTGKKKEHDHHIFFPRQKNVAFRISLLTSSGTFTLKLLAVDLIPILALKKVLLL